MSAPYEGNSTTQAAPGLKGENTAGGDGVVGIGRRGVVGKSTTNEGVLGESEIFHAVIGIAHSGFAGVFGTNNAGGTGVAGESKTGRGVHGISESNTAVNGQSKSGRGIHGESDTHTGVHGQSNSGWAVHGESKTGFGVVGSTQSNFAGVFGINDMSGTGVAGESKNGIGIHGKGGKLAGFFEGDVEVTGDVRLTNADCAEDFNIGNDVTVEPGTVMVLGEDEALFPCQYAYDKRVAGVVSGAGDYKPGIVLDKKKSERKRQPIALLGKVYCKVDASHAPIEVGDMLTTSSKPGYAMRASDPIKAFGAVIGKALCPLKEGQGLIPILIALQ